MILTVIRGNMEQEERATRVTQNENYCSISQVPEDGNELRRLLMLSNEPEAVGLTLWFGRETTVGHWLSPSVVAAMHEWMGLWLQSRR